MAETEQFVHQTVVTDPGEHAHLLGTLPHDLASLKAATFPLFFHYRADGDWEEHGIPRSRADEINTRYVADMLTALLAKNPAFPNPDRPPKDRLLGCCRDWSVMFVAMARAHGIPARMRGGFAGYLMSGWYLDHFIAEVFDGHRWRLIDAELRDDFVDAGTGLPLDPLDVPRDRFLTAPDAWRMARAGELDPELCAVGPDYPLPFLRSWPYLRHNLMLDLASLNGYEMILWDDWGIDKGGFVPDEQLPLLDRVAEASTAEERAALFAMDEFTVPPIVHSSDPFGGDGAMITLR